MMRVLLAALVAASWLGCASTHEGDETQEVTGASADMTDAGERGSAASDAGGRRLQRDTHAGPRDSGPRDVSARDSGLRDASASTTEAEDASAEPVAADAALTDGADARCCVEGENASAFCGVNGTLGPPTACAEGPIDWQVCRQGRCVGSPLIEMGYGADAVDGTWGSVALEANQWRVATVTIPPGADVKVFELRAVLAGVPTPGDGRTIRLALWSDASDAQGRQPGALVAYSSIDGARSGLNSQPITSSLKPVLTAGASYWLGINTSRAGTTLARRAGSGDEVTLAAYAGDVPFDTLQSFPDVAPVHGTSDHALSLLVKSLR